ncbi:hypothetical protein ABTE57_19565, partial [Acinetobacter baumannii]
DFRRRMEAGHVSTPTNANILWFLPTHGDSRYLGTSIGGQLGGSIGRTLVRGALGGLLRR